MNFTIENKDLAKIASFCATKSQDRLEFHQNIFCTYRDGAFELMATDGAALITYTIKQENEDVKEGFRFLIPAELYKKFDKKDTLLFTDTMEDRVIEVQDTGGCNSVKYKYGEPHCPNYEQIMCNADNFQEASFFEVFDPAQLKKLQKAIGAENYYRIKPKQPGQYQPCYWFYQNMIVVIMPMRP